LPSYFEQSDKVYKYGWITIANKKSKGYYAFERKVNKGGDHLTLTPMYEDLISLANIKNMDDAKVAFDKILGAVQTNTTYIFDQDLWGAGNTNHENWSPANIVWTTKKDDCESVSALVISAYDYYKLTRKKYFNSYAFVGTGLYNKSYGHGFPCLYIKKTGNLDDDLFIGEATLSNAVPSRPLSQTKSMYWCNWGNHSFWEDFVFKNDYAWWNGSMATPINEDVKMTGNKVDEPKELFEVKDEKQFKKKKKAIEDFWS
jgi:hypothetical protein